MAEGEKERSKDPHGDELQEENRESAPHQIILLPSPSWEQLLWEKQMGIIQPHGYISHRGLHQGFKSHCIKKKINNLLFNQKPQQVLLLLM